MKNENKHLSDAEWSIMQSLWHSDKALSVREIMDYLLDTKDWSVHTVISFLKRLEAKGAARILEGRPIRYEAILDRAEAVQRETGNILSRVYGGEKLLMIQCAVNAEPLSEEEREELIAILKGGK